MLEGYYVKKIGQNRGAPRVWLEGTQALKASVDNRPDFYDRLREPRKQLAIALSKASGVLEVADPRDALEIARAAGIERRVDLAARAAVPGEFRQGAKP